MQKGQQPKAEHSFKAEKGGRLPNQAQELLFVSTAVALDYLLILRPSYGYAEVTAAMNVLTSDVVGRLKALLDVVRRQLGRVDRCL